MRCAACGYEYIESKYDPGSLTYTPSEGAPFREIPAIGATLYVCPSCGTVRAE